MTKMRRVLQFYFPIFIITLFITVTVRIKEVSGTNAIVEGITHVFGFKTKYDYAYVVPCYNSSFAEQCP